MNHRKLMETLKALSAQQIERLSDFIHSPYFNKNPRVTEVFDYLKPLHPHFSSHKITTNGILQNTQTITDANDLSKKLTLLLELTENFLSWEFNQDHIMEQIGTLKAYKKLHLQRQFDSLANRLKKELKTEPFRDFDYLWQAHRLEEEFFEGFDKGVLRISDNSLDEVFKSLNRFYLTKKLRYMTEAVNRERLLGNAIGNEAKQEILRFLNDGDDDEDLYLSLYGNILKMNLEQSPDQALPFYRKVKESVKAFRKWIPKEEIKSICVHLQNFCIQFINRNDRSYLKEYIDLIELRIDNGILLEEGRINPQQFKNVVVAALKLNLSEWAKSFIKNYSKHLPEEYKSDYYNFALGQYFYHLQDYSQASRHLIIASHNKDDVYFGFAVKKLLLKISFECEDSIFLDSCMAVYKKHLSRYHSRIGENAQILAKFFKYFRLLVNAGRDSDKREILLSKLLAEENFADKDWLILRVSSKPRRLTSQPSLQPVN